MDWRFKKRRGEETWDVYLVADDEWIGTVTHTGRKHWTPRDTDGNACGPCMAHSKSYAATYLRMNHSVEQAKTA